MLSSFVGCTGCLEVGECSAARGEARAGLETGAGWPGSSQPGQLWALGELELRVIHGQEPLPIPSPHGWVT